MNILELCLSPDLGGLELYVVNTCRELSKKDNVIATVNKHGKIKARLQDLNIETLYLSCFSKALPVVAARKLAKIIDEQKIDVIHMHWGKDLALASLAKRFSSAKPMLVYTRQMQITRSKDDFYHRYIYQQVDMVISITEKLANLTRKYLSDNDKSKVRTLYYGIKQTEHFLSENEKQALRNKVGFSKSDFVVGLFGRVEEHKGQYLLIDAIARLQEQGKYIKGLIVGHAMQQSYIESLKQDVRDKDIDQSVSFMDFIENPQDWMQACDVILLASKEETFGLVLAEAMHAGIAVIGTNSGGVPEIIESDKTGLMFKYADIQDLCDCLLIMKNDDTKRQGYAIAGQEKARRLFDLEAHYNQLRKLFKEC